jgi:anti-sigma factor RsiW
MKTKISPRDWETLSAHLDEQLSPRQRKRLQARLQHEPELRTALGELRRTRSVLRSLPRLRSPRNFTLTPEMVGQRRGANRFYPVFGLASALASILLVLVLLGDFLVWSRVESGVAMKEAIPAAEVAVQEVEQPPPEEEMLAAGVTLEAEATVEEEMVMAEAVEEAPTAEAMVAGAENQEAPAPVEEAAAPEDRAADEEEFASGEGEVKAVELESAADSPEEVSSADAEIPAAEPSLEEPAEVVMPSPEPPLEPTPVPDEILQPETGLSFVRIAEIALAALAVVAGFVAIVIRQRGG